MFWAPVLVHFRRLSEYYPMDKRRRNGKLELGGKVPPSLIDRIVFGNRRKWKRTSAQNRNFNFETSSSINQKWKFNLISKLLVVTCSLWGVDIIKPTTVKPVIMHAAR